MTKKELILKVAEEEFCKYGFDAVSMNDLVKKLNINKATIYYHFKDKKNLYQTIIKNALEKSNTNIKSIFEEKEEHKTLLEAYVDATIITIKENPNIVSLSLHELANFSANIDESFIPYIQEAINLLEKVLEELKLKEEYKNIDIHTLFAFINGTIETFYALQMSTLPIGENKELKHNSEKTLNYISYFVSNIILDAIVKK